MSEKYAEPEPFDEIGSRPIDQTGVCQATLSLTLERDLHTVNMLKKRALCLLLNVLGSRFVMQTRLIELVHLLSKYLSVNSGPWLWGYSEDKDQSMSSLNKSILFGHPDNEQIKKSHPI